MPNYIRRYVAGGTSFFTVVTRRRRMKRCAVHTLRLFLSPDFKSQEE
jgi:hypothetical protein